MTTSQPSWHICCTESLLHKRLGVVRPGHGLDTDPGKPPCLGVAVPGRQAGCPQGKGREFSTLYPIACFTRIERACVRISLFATSGFAHGCGAYAYYCSEGCKSKDEGSHRCICAPLRDGPRTGVQLAYSSSCCTYLPRWRPTVKAKNASDYAREVVWARLIGVGYNFIRPLGIYLLGQTVVHSLPTRSSVTSWATVSS